MGVIFIILLMMGVVLVLGIILVIFSVGWSTHIDMVKSDCEQYAKGSYKDFLYQMSQREWVRDIRYPTSFFCTGEDFYKHKVHASIVKFDGVGMIFNIYDWCLVKKYLDKHSVDIPPREITKDWQK